MARSEQLPPVYNDHNVYILGAGFSQDAGLPVISTFMDKMRESPSWLAEHDYARENEAVQRVLKFRLDSAAAAYRVDIDPENIEQLFSLAAATEENDLDRHITLAIAATLEYARSIAPRRTCRFSNITQASSGPTPSWWHIDASFKDIRCELYDFYLGVMTNCWKDPAPGIRNTLVTFNYDLVIEDSLRRMGISYDYGFRENHVHEDHESLNTFGAKLALLKIHGSLNWSICEHKGPAPMEQTEINFNRIHLYKNFRALSQRASQPLLVPPTWRKIPIGPLGDVWNRAVGAIASATRIIVLGYSMPTIDQHFKYLLAAGLQRNICLRNIFFVNPAFFQQPQAISEEIMARIRNVLRPELEDRGIVRFEPLLAETFFFEQSHRAKINRSGPPGNESIRPASYSESSTSS